MAHTIYTVGHSTQSVEAFISLIKSHDINCIVDVRSTPYSQFASQFNENEIKYALKKEGIEYIYMGVEFGARREDKSLYSADGKLDFEKAAASELFQTGIDRIKQGVEKGYRIAFMCTEKEPMDCHRCILIGKSFNDLEEYQVANILQDGALLSQEQVEEKLLDIYYPERDQISITELVEGRHKSDKEYLREAYKKRADAIAYQIQEANK